MNKKILFVSVLSFILAGCVSSAPRDGDMFGASGSVSVSGCPAPMTPMACEGDGKKPVVEIDLDTLTVSPECIYAKKGERITFVLNSTKDIRKGDVVVFPKEATNFFWLARENTSLFTKKKIKVRVPSSFESGDAFPEGIVKYGVYKRDDAKCIDPRINVN